MAVLLLNHEVNKLPLFRRRDPPTKAQIVRLLHEETGGGDSMSKDQFLHFCRVQAAGVGQSVAISLFVMFVLVPLLGAVLQRVMTTYGPVRHLAPKVPQSVFVAVAGTGFSKFQHFLQTPRHRTLALYAALHTSVLALAYTYSHLLIPLFPSVMLPVNATEVIGSLRGGLQEVGRRVDAALGLQAVRHG